MDDLRHLIEDGLQLATCPYCEKVVNRGGTNYAGYVLHNKCYNEFCEELDEYANVTKAA